MLIKTGIFNCNKGFLQKIRNAVNGDPVSFLRQYPGDKPVLTVKKLDGRITERQWRIGSEYFLSCCGRCKYQKQAKQISDKVELNSKG
jgi:hypothetical protein